MVHDFESTPKYVKEDVIVFLKERNIPEHLQDTFSIHDMMQNTVYRSYRMPYAIVTKGEWGIVSVITYWTLIHTDEEQFQKNNMRQILAY